ncbi:hypothetical protein G3A39_39600 [Paraburkholderia aspalathi]|nr:hypothetical protein [Paraburkholderia aspalathi]
MDRRSFFKGAAAAVVSAPIAITASIAVAKAGGRRISSVSGDPGERLYTQLCGDGKIIKAYLNGAEQTLCVTADEAEGMIYRVVSTPGGNIAINHVTGEIMHETVYGDVRIVIG